MHHRNAAMRKPVLLMLKGHPCCGKSTLAQELATQLSWALVDKDDARDCLSALSSDAAALNAVSYAIMSCMAGRQLRCGNSVIVDCPLARLQLWEEASAIAAQVAPFTAMMCSLSMCTMHLVGVDLPDAHWFSVKNSTCGAACSRDCTG